jgi:hypothetical protein
MTDRDRQQIFSRPTLAVFRTSSLLLLLLKAAPRHAAAVFSMLPSHQSNFLIMESYAVFLVASKHAEMPLGAASTNHHAYKVAPVSLGAGPRPHPRMDLWTCWRSACSGRWRGAVLIALDAVLHLQQRVVPPPEPSLLCSRRCIDSSGCRPAPAAASRPAAWAEPSLPQALPQWLPFCYLWQIKVCCCLFKPPRHWQPGSSAPTYKQLAKHSIPCEKSFFETKEKSRARKKQKRRREAEKHEYMTGPEEKGPPSTSQCPKPAPSKSAHAHRGNAIPCLLQLKHLGALGA